MQLSFLQANLNHSAGAQDLFLQSMVEWGIEVAVATEPYHVPTHLNWAGDLDGLAAIVTRPSASTPFAVRERGSGFVTAMWGEHAIVAAYFSPNKTVAELEEYLDALDLAVRRLAPRPVILMGDLNAKSRMWGSAVTDSRGEAVEEFLAGSGLVALNKGTVHTCVRWNGASVIDVSFATPATARRVQNWRVLEGVETLSDHLYIRFEIPTSSRPEERRREPAVFPRWSLSLLDRELAEEAAIVQAWCSPTSAGLGIGELAGRFRDSITEVCDASMPRTKRRPAKRAVYWWSSEIAALRAECTAARRAYTRSRRRSVRDLLAEDQLHLAYREAKKTLRLAISQAKTRAYQELLEDLDRDPWGRPYRGALKKLRSQAPPLTETLQPEFLTRVVGELFPNPPDHAPPVMVPPPNVRVENLAAPPVSDAEMRTAVGRLRKKRTAPGPDGVPGRVLAIALDHLESGLRELFDACLRSGQFPKLWKDGLLCLLRKEGRPPDSPSAYRPIVLLDEVGKLFERILASRLVEHLNDAGLSLSDAQYGFRVGRSTIDALLALKSISQEATDGGERVVAVSLDIANAFNSPPFSTITEALQFFGVPSYLRRLLEDYLHNREVLLVGANKTLVRHRIRCGVPQGSVLGPLLWNLGYDWVLRGALLPRMHILCYADDTLVVARGGTFAEVARLAEVGTTLVVNRIKALGLRVAPHKTEAILFHRPRCGPPPGAHLNIEGARVAVGAQMKYLGLMLDGRWNFEAHFSQLAPRLVGVAAALARLLPNLGGPGTACRRLYMGVIRSMALYGAPVWADALTSHNKTQLRRPQRIMAVRAIRGYRTVSWGAACVLAGSPPWELEAEVLSAVYHLGAERQLDGEPLPAVEREILRRRARHDLRERWEESLASPEYGARTIDAVRPVLGRWAGRKHGALTFRLVQVLSGHGCFGSYLRRVCRRERTAACHECGADEDTAQHTLEVCTYWEGERRTLEAAIGRDLSLPSVIHAMLGSEEAWEAVVSFCEQVISQKETLEREREAASRDPLRQRRRGRRRGRYARTLRPP